MGAMAGLLGVGGGASGTGFNGPQGANIQNPTTQDQVNASNAGVGGSLASQNALLAALQTQPGAANQTQTYNQGQNVFNQLGGGAQNQLAAGAQQRGLNAGLAGINGTGAMGNAMGQQGQFAGQLGNAGGTGAQVGGIQGLQNVLAQQQGTAGQLQGIANGTGPNPAQAALNQATGQNIANQAALMAGQRGAGSNVGLLARQAGQQGAGIQQQAVGQGATMQAQQQMNAINALGAQEAAMGATNQNIAGIGAGLNAQQQAALAAQYGQGAGAVGQLQSGIGQQFGQGATTVGEQQNALGMNAGIAQNQVGNLMGAANQNVQGNLANAGQQMGAMGQFNTVQAGQQGNVNTANAALAEQKMKGQQGLIGGGLSAVGTAFGLAKGGEVKKMADGGNLVPAAPSTPAPVVNGPSSAFGQFLSGMSGNPQGDQDPLFKGMQDLGKGIAKRANAPSAPTAPEADSAGPAAGPDMADISTGSMAAKGGAAHDYRGGGKVKAKSQDEKATVKGNSYSNDKIKAVLSENEVVIPRDVMMSKDPVKGAADFVRKVLAKKRNGK